MAGGIEPNAKGNPPLIPNPRVLGQAPAGRTPDGQGCMQMRGVVLHATTPWVIIDTDH